MADHKLGLERNNHDSEKEKELESIYKFQIGSLSEGYSTNPAPMNKKKPKSGNFKTFINIFRSFVALGILALPYASSNAGLGLSAL